MAIAIINDFSGGQAEDLRTFATNENATTANFNVYTNPHLLVPYIDLVTETVTSGTITDYKLTDVDVIPFGGNKTFVALGRESSVSNKIQFFVKNSSSDITASWLAKAVGGNNVVPNTLVVYKDYAYCLEDGTTTHSLYKYDGSTTVSSIGTITTANYTSTVPRPFVHPEDNVLYFAEGNIIASYNGSSFNGACLTLPSNKVVVSLTNYGTYLAIICRGKEGFGKSVCYLWGRDTSLATLQATIDLGMGQVNFGENLYNNLYFFMSKSNVGSYSNVLSNTLTIKGYAGGAVETIKEFDLDSSLGTGLNIQRRKVNDQVWFGFSNDTAFYRFGKNKDGSYFCSHDRAYPSGTTNMNGFSIIEDFLWIAHDVLGTSNRFYRTTANSESQAYAYTSTYTTSINPTMVIEDRYRKKRLEAVSVSFTNDNSGTVTLSSSIDGGASTTIISSTTAGEVTVEATKNNDSSPLGSGREFQFIVTSTGNARIKEIRYRYEVTNTQSL